MPDSERRRKAETDEVECRAETRARATGAKGQAAQQLDNGEYQHAVDNSRPGRWGEMTTDYYLFSSSVCSEVTEAEIVKIWREIYRGEFEVIHSAQCKEDKKKKKWLYTQTE